VLPVHDYFLVFPECEEELRKVMQREYRRKLGQEIGVERKFNHVM